MLSSFNRKKLKEMVAEIILSNIESYEDLVHEGFCGVKNLSDHELLYEYYEMFVIDPETDEFFLECQAEMEIHKHIST